MQQQTSLCTRNGEQLVEAGRYSLHRNLDYMRLAFVSPRRLLEGFLLETSLLYGLVPFASFVIAYELLYIWNHLQQRPLAFARLLPIPEPAYYLVYSQAGSGE